MSIFYFSKKSYEIDIDLTELEFKNLSTKNSMKPSEANWNLLEEYKIRLLSEGISKVNR